jgi:two-component system sensor histidine kinase YesM
MKQAPNGDLSVRIAKDPRRPLEFESIAEGFNDTLSRLNESIHRQREAQIVAMEAQINPHFLYNTLDTINWMAIDRDEYDISNAISALANILRYAIVNSNAEVTVREETEWLKKYIYLQQYRLKNQFSCRIDAQPEVLYASIHKLLLQPFVENAILHGFDKNQSDPELKVGISKNEDKLEIEIEDNGTGIDPEILDRISQKNYARDFKGSGIGMKNAITRLEMYYGSRAGIEIGTVSPHGTRVLIHIPYSEKEV